MPTTESFEPDELLAAARAGRREGFAGLVRLHQARVFGLALRMLTDRFLAEDLAQEVFLQLHRSIGSIESSRHLVFWLRQVTTRRAIDRLRHERRATTVPLDESLGLVAPEAPADPQLGRDIGALIEQLAGAPRAVMLLRYQEDLDPAEIAQTLGMPVNTVKSHLKRSLALLRAQLSGLSLVESAGDA